jgi:aspartate kinase
MPRSRVIKFGGTSLASPARVRRAARTVARAQDAGDRVVVVVSANGQRTDRLLRAAHAVAPRERGARDLARLLATGEDTSAALFALALHALGAPAISLRGHEAGLHAKGDLLDATLDTIDPSMLAQHLAIGTIPVVSGFHATRDDGEIALLGRGSSDLVAIAIAAALRRAQDPTTSCEIVTDVDGVFECDPHVDPGARRFTALTYATMCALADRGDQVIHAPAARHAAATQTSFHVRHWRDRSGRGGTCVGALTDAMASALPTMLTGGHR